MRYFDTSILAPLIFPEPTSAAVERLIRDLPAEELATSHLARIEFSSSMARRVRMREVAPKDAVRTDRQFDTTIASSFIVLMPTAADFDLCRRYLQRYDTGLRTADALHLAIATNNGATTIYSLDEGLRKAGRILSLPVVGLRP